MTRDDNPHFPLPVRDSRRKGLKMSPLAFFAGLLHLTFEERINRAWSKVLGVSSALELSLVLLNAQEEINEEAHERDPYFPPAQFWVWWDPETQHRFHAHLDSKAHWTQKSDIKYGYLCRAAEHTEAIERSKLGFFYQEEKGPHAGLCFWWGHHEDQPQILLGERALSEEEVRHRVEQSILSTARDAAEEELIGEMSFEDKILY